jgi:hypothetical protein
VRVAEVDLHARLRGRIDVPGHLLALVVREAIVELEGFVRAFR